ncbi:conserved hypothetical protein [Candidatus Desulfosporosinus infrequens]|uniref:Thoeris anti-defense 2-like domain-containing protein n=1 Tax=Candidatus Desulfosporosinus infrequens TaxID=2043169 RepID=A0A2U3LGZ2_9FIRM|nr:conserved hypothetical protein [Candidatus Desulfosporosinus infrequens]
MQYIGVKIIHAEPMTVAEYNEQVRPLVYSGECQDGYKVICEDDYVSWSPKDVFEAAYRQTDGMTFGLAIEAMKKGFKVARQGWNGKAMWIAISHPEANSLKAEGFWNKHSRKFAEENGGSADVLPYIIMKTADNKILMGWLASQTDMLVEDWTIIE